MTDVAQPPSILSTVATRLWWALLLKGVAAVLLGLCALLWPDKTLFLLIIFFGAYALVDGVFTIAAGIMDATRRWLLLFQGALGVLTGLVAFFWPDLTALVLLYVIAFWAIFTGAIEVIAAISLRREVENEWLMILSGLLSVLFGLLLAFLPGVGLVSLMLLLGIYALIFGVAFIVLGFKLRGHRTDTSRVA